MRSRTAVVLGCLALSACLIGCESERVVDLGPDQQPRFSHAKWWHYQYVYHPRDQVYFEPYTRVYHWYDGTEWQSGPELPPQYAIDASTAIVVKHRTDHPPFHHQRSVALGGIMIEHHPDAPGEVVE